MAKYKTGQNVTVVATGEETHIRMQDGNGRYILQNGDEVRESEIVPTEEAQKKKRRFGRKK